MWIGLNLLMMGSSDLMFVSALMNCFDPWQCGFYWPFEDTFWLLVSSGTGFSLNTLVFLFQFSYHQWCILVTVPSNFVLPNSYNSVELVKVIQSCHKWRNSWTYSISLFFQIVLQELLGNQMAVKIARLAYWVP